MSSSPGRPGLHVAVDSPIPSLGPAAKLVGTVAFAVVVAGTPATPPRSPSSRRRCSPSSWWSRGSRRAGCSLAWPTSSAVHHVRSGDPVHPRTGRAPRWAGCRCRPTGCRPRGTWWPGRPWAQPRRSSCRRRRHCRRCSGMAACVPGRRGHRVVDGPLRRAPRRAARPHAHRDGVEDTTLTSSWQVGPVAASVGMLFVAPTSVGNRSRRPWWRAASPGPWWYPTSAQLRRRTGSRHSSRPWCRRSR